MGIEKRSFGTLPDGSRATLFSFDGGGGVAVSVSDFGGIITSVTSPDRWERPGEICVGFADPGGYAGSAGYCGALIGRVANRIAEGRFSLGGIEYRLTRNYRGMHLHGGKSGFNAKLWEAETDNGRLILRYLSPDGEEGYPGALSVTVRYSLCGPALTIEYEARCDAPTLVNMTSHAYFNLSCFKRDILGHELLLSATRYHPAGPLMIPSGISAPVAGTPFDFTNPKPIGRDISMLPAGYNHHYVFDNGAADSWQAEVRDPGSGRVLLMRTSEPGVQFYSGNSLDGTLRGMRGEVFSRHSAFCLEAQRLPNAINNGNGEQVLLAPNSVYRQTTVYAFSYE